ncbi:MAG TPA: glycosyltransferase [Thermoanaerobaculia bacterium]|nr:glycosyltransferase [Thermoanaerobaculia bacterium]
MSYAATLPDVPPPYLLPTSSAITILIIYYGALSVITLYALHRLYLLRLKGGSALPSTAGPLDAEWPPICVQLPLFNEPAVAVRLMEATGRLEYPGRFEIQVLDDSTDDTTARLSCTIEGLRANGVQVEHIRRGSRTGYKAGALAFGMTRSRAELFAIFDADFVPAPDTLIRMAPQFTDPEVGMVQARWTHLNRDESALTQAQAIYLDAHFSIESSARFAAGRFFNFNGTAGIWRRSAIDGAGGWSSATLTEDLHLSYRAQLAGWKFVFLPDVQVPAELPPTMGAFQEQQFRWAKGSIQTARRLIGSISHASLPLATKLESFFHLTSNSAYLVTLVLSFILVPALQIRRALQGNWLYAADFLLFAVSTISVMWFYLEGQRRVGRMRPRWRDLSLLIPIGIGLSIRNSVAVLEGLVHEGGEFRRTPKRGSSPALLERAERIPLAESLLALHFAIASITALIDLQLASLPFLTLFLTGYAFTAISGWRDRWISRESTRPDEALERCTA